MKNIFLTAAEIGTDIIKEIPASYMAIFIIFLVLILFLSNKILSKIFSPKKWDETPQIFEKKKKRGFLARLISNIQKSEEEKH